MSMTLIVGALVALIVGAVLFALSVKQRDDKGEWSGMLQWGYLLMLVGLFGVLSIAMSFTAVLLIFVVVTGIVWYWHRQRIKNKEPKIDDNHFSDYLSGFFPIILVVFVLRTFIAEPFQIPSSSMRPGLVVGDFILVNKFAYGIRLPILNNVLIPTQKVARGDVVVFNYPENTKVNYIKRVIGLPGDKVTYKDRELMINDQKVASTDLQKVYSYTENTPAGPIPMYMQQWREYLADKSFDVVVLPEQPAVFTQGVRTDFPYRKNCTYAEDGSGFTCIVPAGHYFMMGDNRDNSEDSRYWGFVDDRLLVGKAFLVWLNFNDMSRIGTKIK